MLINLTNHPSALWSEEQKKAAERYGEIIDLPFPAVDATGDETNIASLADEYVQKLKDLANGRDVTVHLMGEMTLTFALVRRLQTNGIRCVASTTQRIVTETEPNHKEVIFQFIKFRRYE